MEFRVLRYFLTVAREGNISGAANTLHLSQPTLSRQLIELEESLGVTLFIRGKRKITLTEEGILLKKRAEEIVELIDKTESELSLHKEFLSGNIYIGCGETDAMKEIAQIARNVQIQHPKIKFHIYSGNADDVTERLDKGLIDFGILIGEINTTKYNHIALNAKDNWGILMPKSCPLAAHKTIEPHHLWSLPLITSRKSITNDILADWIQKDIKDLNIVATYNLVYNASLMVEKGFGYAFCIDKLVSNPHLCFRPLNPGLASEINFVWKKQQIFSKSAEIFLNHIKASL